MSHEAVEARHTHGEIVKKYDRIASIYDIFGILMESKARRRALELASIRDGDQILEAALGTGLNFVHLLRRTPLGWVDGVDVSIRMLQRAEKRIAKTGQKNYSLRLCDCRHLPFEEATFDIVTSHYLLDILPVKDYMPILLEFKRVLKPGGRLVLVHMTRGEKWINAFYQFVYRMRLPLLAGCRGVLARPFLEEVGLKDLHREFISQTGFPSEVIRGIKQ
jgi:ubiquinone/menaquinone biosynthesis C-methylase UbiE